MSIPSSLTTFLLVVLLASSVSADRLGDRTRNKQNDSTRAVAKSAFHFGFKFGLVTGGSAHIEKYEYDLDAAESFGLFLDLPNRMGAVGRLSLDFHKVKPFLANDGSYLMDLSFGVVWKDRNPTHLTSLNPAISMGYGRVTYEDLRGHFLVVRAYLDFLFRFRTSSSAIIWEIGAIAAPYGRMTGDMDVRADPRPLIRLGVLF
ncbi:MAG TPA: hypothetical protein VMS71_02330 [Candidatus Acidoferrum sp.]|nr:hypothetical protein [Candidatus Acidoferrum sp.]